MPDKKISELTDGGTATVGDVLPAVRGGVNVKVTMPSLSGGSAHGGSGEVQLSDGAGGFTSSPTLGFSASQLFVDDGAGGGSFFVNIANVQNNATPAALVFQGMMNLSNGTGIATIGATAPANVALSPGNWLVFSDGADLWAIPAFAYNP